MAFLDIGLMRGIGPNFCSQLIYSFGRERRNVIISSDKCDSGDKLKERGESWGKVITLHQSLKE